MSLETTLDFTNLNRNETQHFVGVIDGAWPYDGTLYTKYDNGRVAEQSVGISINASAVQGPAEAKFVIDVTRKATDKMGGLSEPTVETHYNGAIYGKSELQNDPPSDVIKYFFKMIAPAIDAKLEAKRESGDMRFGLAAKLYE